MRKKRLTWLDKLREYIDKTPKEMLTPQNIGEYLGVSPWILCQEILYVYDYSLMEFIEVIKDKKKEPKNHRYTPLEHYLYGNLKPKQHQPMNTWLMTLDLKHIDLEDMTISGVKVPYSKINYMERNGFPGQRKDENSLFVDPPEGINYAGAWILEDSQTGEMSYFYGSTGKDQEDRRRIYQKYRTSLTIPGGKYVWTEYESDYRIYGYHKLYGGGLVRNTAVLRVNNSYHEFDNSRFIFEMYNEKNELSIYFPVK